MFDCVFSETDVLTQGNAQEFMCTCTATYLCKWQQKSTVPIYLMISTKRKKRELIATHNEGLVMVHQNKRKMRNPFGSAVFYKQCS